MYKEKNYLKCYSLQYILKSLQVESLYLFLKKSIYKSKYIKKFFIIYKIYIKDNDKFIKVINILYILKSY